MEGRVTFLRSGTWLLIAAAPLMGIALLVAVGSTYRSVQAASEKVVRGQLDIVQDALRFSLADPVNATHLDELLDTYAPDGLRYLAVLDDGRIVLAEAGTRLTDGPAPAELPAGEVAEVGDRVRAIFRAVRPRGSTNTTELRAHFLIEIEPQAANSLEREARFTLGVGAVAALTLLALAMLLIRVFLRRQKLERALESERRLASLGEMSAVLAHEIRNPLASLKGNAQLLARAIPGAEPTRRKADRVVDEATRLEKLVNDLLELARSQQLQRSDGDPMLPVRRAVQSVEREIQIEGSAAPASWPLDVDRMSQVLTNLITNAVQASDDGVQVRVYRDREQLVYEVQDRGGGIAPEDLRRIFEPFFTRRTQGTGLGLAVSRRLVEMHGGTIGAENVPGGGAKFTVRIPSAR